MELIGKEILVTFKNDHPDARSQVEAWEAEVENSEWITPHDLKRRYPKATLLGNQQAVFDICWNKYRLWVKVAYNTSIIVIKAIGTHREYDQWKFK